jgi:uncharacterized protein with GYD domain
VALYMYQFAYTSQSWGPQFKNPQNRIEKIGRAAVEAAGGKFIGGWLCIGEYDAVLIVDLPNLESMAGLALAVAAGGSIKTRKTTALMSGDEGVEALRKAATVAKTYQPAR